MKKLLQFCQFWIVTVNFVSFTVVFMTCLFIGVGIKWSIFYASLWPFAFYKWILLIL